jgi:hypothetical protein
VISWRFNLIRIFQIRNSFNFIAQFLHENFKLAVHLLGVSPHGHAISSARRMVSVIATPCSLLTLCWHFLFLRYSTLYFVRSRKQRSNDKDQSDSTASVNLRTSKLTSLERRLLCRAVNNIFLVIYPIRIVSDKADIDKILFLLGHRIWL